LAIASPFVGTATRRADGGRSLGVSNPKTRTGPVTAGAFRRDCSGLRHSEERERAPQLLSRARPALPGTTLRALAPALRQLTREYGAIVDRARQLRQRSSPLCVAEIGWQ